MEEKIAEAMEAQKLLEEEREQKILAIRKREVILMHAWQHVYVSVVTIDFWEH